MAEQSIKNRLIVLVAEQLDVDEEEIGVDSSFFTDLGVDDDEDGLVDLWEAIGEEFQVNAPKNPETIRTIQQAVRYIEINQ